MDKIFYLKDAKSKFYVLTSAGVDTTTEPTPITPPEEICGYSFLKRLHKDRYSGAQHIRDFIFRGDATVILEAINRQVALNAWCQLVIEGEKTEHCQIDFGSMYFWDFREGSKLSRILVLA